MVCLLSALRFHRIGVQNPFEVWMAIPAKAAPRRPSYPPIHFVHFSGRALTDGVEEHAVPEGPVRVYSVVKTVVDCFRYRNKIGIDVALEALRESWRHRRVTMGELWHQAERLRAARVMHPYLESLA